MFFFLYLSSISIFVIEKKKNKIINCLSLNENFFFLKLQGILLKLLQGNITITINITIN